MTVTLVVGAGLLVRSLVALERVDVGTTRPEEILTFGLSLGGERTKDPIQQAAFYRGLLEKITALPAVRAAGAAFALPMGGDDNGSVVWLEGAPLPEAGKEEVVGFQSITPG
jgi:hypothetical protein